jgi:carbonic anhydrase
VHVNTKYNNGDINAALASGSPDALLVVGQMFKVGASQSSSMDEIAAGIASSDVAVARSIVASDLMDTRDGYYTYPGSLTTPTCNPVVTWVVLASAIDVTEVCLRACTSYRA